MSQNKTLNTPIGELRYTFVTGEGRENLSGVAQYSTQLVLSEEAAAPLIEEIETLWAGSGIKKQPKSFGYKTLDDGNIAFSFKTNVESKFGRNKVDLYDSKGKKFDLGDILIGNGTKGRIGGTLAIYDGKTGSGVTLYLNRIQIIELVEYTGGDSNPFDEVEGGYTHQTEFEAAVESPAVARF